MTNIIYSAYSTYTNPSLTTSAAVSTIRKPYDDLDLIAGGRYGPRPLTPTSPVLSGNWGLDSYDVLDGVNPAFIHTQPHLRLGALDLESKGSLLIKRIFFNSRFFPDVNSMA